MKRAFRSGLYYSLICATLIAPHLAAQDVDWEDEEYVQLPLGLTASYETSSDGVVLERMEPATRLFGEAHDSVHWQLPADRFRATWRGRLVVPYDGLYTFTLGASSLANLKLSLYGKPVEIGQAVELYFGNVPFELSGVHTGGEPALELAWQNELFDNEVIAPWHFAHTPEVAVNGAVVHSALLESGAALAESFGCFRCHAGPGAWVGSINAGLDFEVTLPGASLTATGGRLHRRWVTDFLADPAANRPGTRMPAQFKDSPEDRAAIEVIAAYLTSGQTSEVALASPGGLAESGEEIYRSHGCAACHEPPDGTLDARGVPLRIPRLEGLAAKWTVAGLVGFLKSPLSTRLHGRMPDFALSDVQARHLVAYLLGASNAGVPPRFVGLPEPKQPVTVQAGSLVDPTARLLSMSLDDTGGKLVNSSGKNFQGSVIGQVVYAMNGAHDQALGFDGKGGHVVIDGTERVSSNGLFTWSAFIRTKGSGAIISHAPAEGDWASGGKTLFVRDGQLCFDVGWVGVISSETKVNDNVWHHVAVTVETNTDEKNDTVVLYVDGRQEAVRDDWNVNRPTEVPMALKLAKAADDFPQKKTFAGLIDEVAIWRRVLDPEEIMLLGEGGSHLSETEAALFTADELRRQWVGLGENAEQFDRYMQGTRLKAVALRQMARFGCLDCHHPGKQSLLGIERGENGPPRFGMVEPPAAAGSLVGLSAERIERGCLAPGALSAGSAPVFDFSPDERAALAAYAATLGSQASPSLSEAVSVQMKLLNCAACHENDGAGGEPLVELLGGGEEAQFIVPMPLTGVAGRVRPERLDAFIRQGARKDRMRPWTEARMPGFGDRGGRLARDLCIRDRVSRPPAPGEKSKQLRPAVPQNQVEMGRLLVSNKGLTCVNCHEINGQKPAGEVEPSTRAPDLGLVADHVRREHYDRLLRNPERVFPGTKMPVIFPKEGPGLVPALDDLPQEALSQALWAYLSLGRDAPTPIEEEPAEMLPDMLRVYVQRGPTFVGERLFGRGITCGFPTGTLLYDADVLEPAAVWYDGFLNRIPTHYFGLNWRAPDSAELFAADRHSIEYRGESGQPWQKSPLPLECDPNTESRFDGYTVGRREVTFRYRLAFDGRQVPVVERLRIDQRDGWRGFVRELSFGGLRSRSQISWTLPEAKRYRFVAASGSPVARTPMVTAAAAPVVVYRTDDGVHAVRVEASAGAAWQVGPEDSAVRLILPGNTAAQPVGLRIDRWRLDDPAGREPEPAEIARLSDPALLEQAHVEAEPKSQVLPPLAPAAAVAEEPFTYKIEPLPSPPEGWRPSGSAFGSDGTVYAAGLTEGRVYRARMPSVPVEADFQWQLYATGLNVPTGMNVIDDRLYVSQRPEVTELIDADGDGTVETFRTVMGPWSLKDGFHEYAFGLAVDPQERMYVGLNNGYFWSYGGPTNRGRHRSDVLRCDVTGQSEVWGHGCRVPNGICRGPGGDIFYCDNQGDWIQVCKIVHCRKGVFYGHPETEDEFLPDGEVPSALPAIWIPYTVIRSAAALGTDETGGRFGPFAGQMFVGDTGYGQSVNVMRAALEKVDGVWQGAAMRFIDGPPRGPQHTMFGPDGQMYISCLTDGVVRIRYGGKVPMEIHHVSLRRDGRGFVLHFTKPISRQSEVSPRTIRARRWYYPYGIRYGSPRVEEVDVPIAAAELSADRMAISLDLPIKTYKNCMVYYFNVAKLESADGQPVEHPEAWYTLQRTWK